MLNATHVQSIYPYSGCSNESIKYPVVPVLQGNAVSPFSEGCQQRRMGDGESDPPKQSAWMRLKDHVLSTCSRICGHVRSPRLRRELPRTVLATCGLLTTIALMTAAQVWGDRVFVLRVLGPRLVPEAAQQIEGQSTDWETITSSLGSRRALPCSGPFSSGCILNSDIAQSQSNSPLGSLVDYAGNSLNAIPSPMRKAESISVLESSDIYNSVYSVTDENATTRVVNDPKSNKGRPNCIRAAFEPIGQYAMEPLYDAVIDMLPDLSSLRSWLPDLLLTTHIAAVVVLALLIPGRPLGLSTRFVILRRFLLTQTLLYAMRTALILCTTVPSPVPACVPPLASSLADQLVLMGRMARGVLTGCTDNIYSAHTALATNLLLFAALNCGRWLQIALHLVHWLALLFVILATRLHYTVDVVLAAMVTFGVFGLYHLLLAVAVLAASHSQSIQDKEVRRALAPIPQSALLALAWLDGLDLRRANVQMEAEAESHQILGDDTCTSQKTVACSTQASVV